MKIGRAANKKQETETRIYEAGMKLFEEKGVNQTTLMEICELAGVSKGTFFNYFSSKEDIVAKFGQGQLKILSAFAETLPPTMGTKDKIIAVLLEDIRTVKESKVIAGITLKGISEGGEMVHKLESNNRKNLALIYEKILLENCKPGNSGNLSLASNLIVTIYFHVLDKHYSGNETFEELEHFIMNAVDILFNGIKDCLSN